MAECTDPFTEPSVFRGLIPNPNERVCDQFLKQIEFSKVFFDWYSDMFTEEGCLSQKFLDAISEGGGATTTTGTTTTGTTTAPPVGGSEIFPSPGTFSFVVPPGVSTLTAELWGAGAGGGDGHRPPGAPAGSTRGSGGGGGGGGYTSTTLAVTPGETLTILVPAGGTGGVLDGFNKLNGGNGGDSRILRGAAIIADANGGTGGGAGHQICGLSFVGGTGGPGGNGATATGSNGTAVTPDTTCLAVAPGTGGAGAQGGNGNGGNGGADQSSGISGSSGRVELNF